MVARRESEQGKNGGRVVRVCAAEREKGGTGGEWPGSCVSLCRDPGKRRQRLGSKTRVLVLGHDRV